MSESGIVITPHLVKWIAGDLWLNGKRQLRELGRAFTGQPHVLHVFVHVTDPYSFLLLQVLPEIEARYHVRIRVHTLAEQSAQLANDDSEQAFILTDADRLAKRYSLNSPHSGLGVPDDPAFIQRVTQLMVNAEQHADAVSLLTAYLYNFWHGIDTPHPRLPAYEQQLANNQRLFNRLGHARSASIYYQGEWYGGIDRLDHLEQRLNQLIVHRGPAQIRYQQQRLRLTPLPDRHSLPANAIIEMYYSARCPYCYLGLELVSQLADYYGCQLRIYPVLSTSKPGASDKYELYDVRREAKKYGLAYGFATQALSHNEQNCYALFPYAHSVGREQQFLLTFGRAVNQVGLRADKPAGLRRIVESCGLDWQRAQTYLQDPQWRDLLNNNQQQFNQEGVSALPCFKYQDILVCGQDRLWLIEQQLRHATTTGET